MAVRGNAGNPDEPTEAELVGPLAGDRITCRPIRAATHRSRFSGCNRRATRNSMSSGRATSCCSPPKRRRMERPLQRGAALELRRRRDRRKLDDRAAGHPRAARPISGTHGSVDDVGRSRAGEKYPRGNYCSRGARFGVHSSEENFANPYYGKLTSIAYFNGGVRIWDIREPQAPREIAFYVPEANAKTDHRRLHDQQRRDRQSRPGLHRRSQRCRDGYPAADRQGASTSSSGGTATQRNSRIG